MKLAWILSLCLVSAIYADGPINLRDVGVVADGVTDDAPAIQAAIDSNPGSVFVMPDKSTVLIKSTIQIHNGGNDGTSIVGNHKSAYGVLSFLKWGGPSGGYMIDVEGASGCYFSGFGMIVDGANRAINFDRSPGTTGSATKETVDGMFFQNTISNPGLIMVSLAYTSLYNCEEARIKNSKFIQAYDAYNPKNLNRGIGISLGNAAGGGGANNFNQLVEECEFTGFSTDISCYFTKAQITNNEFQGATVNIDGSSGSNELLIQHNRPENSRQFLKAGWGNYLVQFNSIALNGSWDAVYPTIEQNNTSGRLTLINNTWNDDPGNTIIPVAQSGAAGGNNSTLISQGNHYPNLLHVGSKCFGTFRYYLTQMDEAVKSTSLARVQSGRVSGFNYQGAPFVASPVNFSSLGTVCQDNGTIVYVPDGKAGVPLTSGGAGAIAFRLNGMWIGY